MAAIYQAIIANNIKAVKQFLDSGANVNKSYNGITFLEYAARENNIPIMQLLLEYGADANILKYAVAKYSLEAIQLLLVYGADINLTFRYDKNLLHLTIENNWGDLDRSLAIITKLLEYGIAVNNGCNIIDYILRTYIRYLHPVNTIINILTALIDHGADLSTSLVSYIMDNRIIKLLIDAGANVNAQDQWGRTAMMHAIINGDIPRAYMLLEAGADLNIQDIHGRTALHQLGRKFGYDANAYKLYQLGRDLIKAGASPHILDSPEYIVLNDSRYGIKAHRYPYEYSNNAYMRAILMGLPEIRVCDLDKAIHRIKYKHCMTDILYCPNFGIGYYNALDHYNSLCK